MSELPKQRFLRGLGVAGLLITPFAWPVGLTLTALGFGGAFGRLQNPKGIASIDYDKDIAARDARKEARREAKRVMKERLELQHLNNLHDYNRHVYDTEQREITQRQATVYAQADTMFQNYLNALSDTERARVTGYRVHEPRVSFFGRQRPLEIEILRN